MINKIIIILLLFCSPVYAQEVIEAFSEDTLPVLNNELKKMIDDIDSVCAEVFPVGSIYINATNSANPSTLLGCGTWTAFGTGRIMVAINSSDTDFDAAEETGGAKTQTIAQTNLPSVDFDIKGRASGASSEATMYQDTGGGSTEQSFKGDADNTTANGKIVAESGGSGTAFSIVQPYITVYMWKRTA